MSALGPEEEDRARRLHRDSIVVDTLGMPGPSVYTTEMLPRIEDMVVDGESPSLIVAELERLTLEAVIRAELPGFWEGWEASGVNVSSVTVGAFGDPPFTFENAQRDLTSTGTSTTSRSSTTSASA